jgi:hypothetical protein
MSQACDARTDGGDSTEGRWAAARTSQPVAASAATMPLVATGVAQDGPDVAHDGPVRGTRGGSVGREGVRHPGAVIPGNPEDDLNTVLANR